MNDAARTQNDLAIEALVRSGAEAFVTADGKAAALLRHAAPDGTLVPAPHARPA